MTRVGLNSVAMASPAIFISYGREPEVNDFVEALKRYMTQELSCTVWIDVDCIKIGDRFHNGIGIGISKCDIFLAVVTEKFMNSAYCPE
jgi:hypothetical protein